MTERPRWFESKGTIPEHVDWRPSTFYLRETETDIDPDGNPTGDTP